MSVIVHGDCLAVLPGLPAESIDACCTDPPYELKFMAKTWDDSGVAFSVETWRAVFRVLKPGAHLLAFGGTRTSHRMVCAIEDAGFEIRDSLIWMYGQGFPKSLDVGDGLGTALKPAHEPIVLARKPFKGTVAANVAKHGTGALNIDACRISTTDVIEPFGTRTNSSGGIMNQTNEIREQFQQHDLGRWPANVCLDEWHERVLYLRDNVNGEVARVIRQYFDQVPLVRHDDPHVPEPRQAEEVLQPEMLCGLVEHEPERRQSPHEGPDASSFVDCQDDADEGGARAPRLDWREECGMEGRQVPHARVRDGGLLGVVASRTKSVRVDVEQEQPSGYPGASSCRGSQARESATAVRGGSSLEREQAGQPLQESGTARQRHAQANPQSDSPGAAEAAPRKRTASVRTLEVLESDVPSGWLTYFADTSKTVRRGAAAALDEMTGELTSGFMAAGQKREGIGYHGGLGDTVRNNTPADSGGASRFYYVAKPSREERDYGTEGLQQRQRDTNRKAGNPGGDNPRNRGLQPRGNFHPTVKPVELMRWLVKLVTPIGGTVLDPFLGSGSTGMACKYELRGFIGIEREAEYLAIAEARIAAVTPLFTETA